MSRKLRVDPLLTFYVLAFVLAWSVKIPVVLSHTDNLALRLLPSFFPAVAAVITAAVYAGSQGVRDLRSQLSTVRVGIVWYLVALAVPVGLNLLAVILAVPFGESFPGFDFPGVRVLPVVLVATFFALGEELGWRGFALPRLELRFNMLIAGLVVGLLWWAWHLPEALAGPSAGLSLAQIAGLELRDVFLDVAASILMAWIYAGTGRSLLLVTLFHVGIGLLGEFLALPQAGGVSLVDIFFDVLLCLAAGIVTLAQTQRLSSGKPQML